MAALDAFTRHLLDRVSKGETYAAALELAGLFLDEAPSQYPRDDLARHLVALASNVHGSFNWATDRFDHIEEMRARRGQAPRRVASEATVRRHLRPLAPREVEDLVNGLLRRLLTVGVARGELQAGYDLVLDETTFPFYGLGRMQVTQAPRDGKPRETLRTEASRQAMPLPPDKYHATRKGFPFHVLGVRFTGTRRTVPLAYVRRRPGFATMTGEAVGALLPLTAGLPAPGWILMDKGYASSDTVRLIQDTLRANDWERTRFLVPVVRKTGEAVRGVTKTQAVSPMWNAKPRLKPRQKSGPSRSLVPVAQRHYPDAAPALGRAGERFVLLRDWQVSQDDARAKCNLFLYYRPERMASGKWVMDWDAPRSWIGFYTNAEPAPETAYAVSRAYSARWGIEILHKRDHGFMGLSKSQQMHPRDITYGLGLVLAALENAHRTQVLLERGMRQRAGAQGRRARRRVVRTHEVLGDWDRQAHGLAPA